MTRWLMLGALTACHGPVRDAFDAREAMVLAAPAPLGLGWSPDATLKVSTDALADATRAALADLPQAGQLQAPGMSATPNFTVARLDLRPAHLRCTGCLGVDATLTGELEIAVFGFARAIALEAEASFDARIDAVQDEDAWTLQLHPERIEDVRVRFQGAPGGPASYLDLSPVEGWLSATLESLPPTPIATLAGAGDVLRGLRFAVDGPQLRVDLALNDDVASPVSDAPTPTQGWSAHVRTEAILTPVRRALFAQGPIDRGVWADPTSLTLHSDRFVMLMRLWRPTAGWWRDYRVDGTWALQKGRLTFKADGVTEVGASKGAGLADPLAVLAKGAILKGLEDAIAITVPARVQADVGQGAMVWRVRTLQTQDDVVVVAGDLKVRAPKR